MIEIRENRSADIAIKIGQGMKFFWKIAKSVSELKIQTLVNSTISKKILDNQCF